MRKTTLFAAGLLLAAAWLLTVARPTRADQVLAVTETPTSTATATATSTATPLPTATALPATETPVSSAAPALSDPLITKRVDLARAAVGDRVEYSIAVVNPNAVDVLNVAVSDPLPAQLDFVDGSTTAGTLTYDSTARTVAVVIGTLTARQEVTIVVRARVNELGQPPDQVTNLAFLSFANGAGQAVTAQASAASVLFVPAGLPDTGYGPGPREWAWLGGGAGLLGLAVFGVLRWARRRRA